MQSLIAECFHVNMPQYIIKKDLFTYVTSKAPTVCYVSLSTYCKDKHNMQQQIKDICN